MHTAELSPVPRDGRFPQSLTAGLSKRELPGLGALRAISAYLVVFYHFSLAWVPGGLGVLAFFVLSGFLITWLLTNEFDRSGTISLRNFYLRRSLRIFPAFYAYSAAVLGLLLITGKHIVWPQTLAALTYVNNYYQALNGDPNTAFSHTWSLAIEEQFYLLWPLLFLSLASKRKTLTAVLAFVIVAIWVHRWDLVARGASSGYLYEAFDTRADHLLVGCALALVLRAGWLSRLWRAVCCHQLAPLMTLGALMASTAAAGSAEHYRDTIGFVVDPLLVALLIVQLIAFSESSGWRWTNTRVPLFLGQISYSLYLYQQITSSLIESALKGRPFALQLVVYVAGVTVVATMSYLVIERPFLRLKDRFAVRREPLREVVANGAPRLTMQSATE